MKKGISFVFPVLGLIATALLSPAFAASPDNGEGLWKKAVETASASKKAGIVPGTITMMTVVKNKEGEVENNSTVKMKTVDNGNDLDMEMVSVIEDGKDVTAEARKEIDEKKKAGGGKTKGKDEENEGSVSFSLNDNPFDPNIQNEVKAFYQSDSMIDKTPAALFTFVQFDKAGKTILKGKAWLDRSTGVPIKIESAPETLPKHVDKLHTKTAYTTTSDGLWVPSSSLIVGEGGFLWMHFFTETRVVFSDYRISPVKPGLRK